MKRFTLLTLAILFLLAACAPAPAPVEPEDPAELSQTEKNYLTAMDLSFAMDDPAIRALISFPQDVTHANDDYRLTLCALYADYADKRMLIKVEPLRPETEPLFAQDPLDSASTPLPNGTTYPGVPWAPGLHLPDAPTAAVSYYSNQQQITRLSDETARYYYLRKDLPIDQAFLFFPYELMASADQETMTFGVEVEDISVPVDISSSNQPPLVFHLDAPVGEDGLVLDTLTLGALSTALTFHYPNRLESTTISDTLHTQAKNLSATWTDAEGQTQEFSFRLSAPGSFHAHTEDGNDTISGTTYRDHTPLPLDQVTALTLNGTTYTPEAPAE